jgi:hypothetical protein
LTRVLFCWELGANLGHLGLIAAMRDELEAAGFAFSFAVADLLMARSVLGDTAPLLPAPRWPFRTHNGARSSLASFADVLSGVGFHQPDLLGLMVDAWRTLLRLTGAEVAVIDHGPAAQIATMLEQIPAILVGSAFTLPPLTGDAFPLLRADIPPAIPESRLLESVRAVMADRGATTLPQSLPEALAGSERVAVGLPELDPYAPFRRGGLHAPAGGYSRPADAGLPLSVFAYLGPELPDLHEKVQVLCALPCAVEIYVRGGDPFLAAFVRRRGKVAYETPAVMADVFSRATHVVSMGGAMLCAQALSAGRPHLMLPLTAETGLNAMLVGRIGAGQNGDARATPEAFAAELARFVDDVAMADRARDAGRVLASRPLPDAGAALARWLRQTAEGLRTDS